MSKNIKRLLKLKKRTNSERMKLTLLIIKYKKIFSGELKIYNKVRENIINNIKYHIRYNGLKIYIIVNVHEILRI